MKHLRSEPKEVVLRLPNCYEFLPKASCAKGLLNY